MSSMNSFKEYFQKEFEDRSKNPDNWTEMPFGWGKARVHTDVEMKTAIRDSLVDSAFNCVNHYKNTSPKYIISKMSVVMGGISDYNGREGCALIITELIREGRLALDKEGQLYEVK